MMDKSTMKEEPSQSFHLRRTFLPGAFFLAACAFLFQSPANHQTLFGIQDGVFSIQDFTFYYSMVLAFWEATGQGIYSVDEILSGLKLILGIAPTSIIPNPISPTAVFIWAPLVFLFGKDSIAGAYWGWMIISLGTLSFALKEALRSHRTSNEGALYLTLVLLCSLLSTVAQRTLMLGQTTIYAAGVLTLLMSALMRPKDTHSSRWREAVINGGLLFLASIKLPYFILGLAFLLAAKQGRAVPVVSVLCLLSYVFGALWMGPSWCAAYPSTIYDYLTWDFSRSGFYWGSFNGDTPTWSRISEGYVPDIIRIGVLWLGRIGSGIVFLGVLFGYLGSDLSERMWFTVKAMLSGYLLFSSYLGEYEDLLLILVPLSRILCLKKRQSEATLLAELLLLVLALTDIGLPLGFRFACKFLVLAL